MRISTSQNFTRRMACPFTESRIAISTMRCFFWPSIWGALQVLDTDGAPRIASNGAVCNILPMCQSVKDADGPEGQVDNSHQAGSKSLPRQVGIIVVRGCNRRSSWGIIYCITGKKKHIISIYKIIQCIISFQVRTSYLDTMQTCFIAQQPGARDSDVGSAAGLALPPNPSLSAERHHQAD